MRRTVAGLAFVASACAWAAPPEGFDARVEAVMQQQGIPGAAIAIVEDGETTLARGYGIKSLQHPEPVGPDSLFQIGSTTKAFTAAALAILVDEGRIGWETRSSTISRAFACTTPGSRARSRSATCWCTAADWGADKATCCTSPPRP